MDCDRTEGEWKQFESKIKDHAGTLSDDEVEQMAKEGPIARSTTDSPCKTGGGDAGAIARGRRQDENGTTGMIGLVVVTHGGLAEAFLAALEYIVGPQTQLEAISIAPADDVEAPRYDILAAVRRVDTGAGVVLLTDMFGGTPSNLSISILEEVHVQVISGVNLPMLVKLATVRGRVPLAEAVDLAKEAGRKYICVASQVLSGEPGRAPGTGHTTTESGCGDDHSNRKRLRAADEVRGPGRNGGQEARSGPARTSCVFSRARVAAVATSHR